MPEFDKCPLCPSNSRPVLLIGGKCYEHWKDSSQKIERAEKAEKVAKPIKKVSSNRKQLDREYSKSRKLFLKEHPMCEAKVKGCKKVAEEIHHKRGKIGDNYLNIGTWIAVCRTCHTWIETHPAEAKEKGLSASRLKKAS